jgi:serine/threonine-protein kinase
VKVGSLIAAKFRIERVIGRGAMGVVVEATDLTLGRRVAVKLILPQYAGDEQLRGRFIREAHAMTRLTSEHVAQVLEVGELPDGTRFMVMEYLEGQSLEDMVQSAGPLPPSEAVDLILEALDAIAEAHDIGLVHRDVKPSNLFLAARKGKPPIVKVLDFGIVKDTTSGQRLTATGTLPGTPAYMAPELVAMQEQLIDARADIWAIGVTLYELLTGELPFNGPIHVMLSRIRTEAPPRLRARRPDIAPELEAIVMRCLSKHPAERYANGRELAAALRELRMKGFIRADRGERLAATTEVSVNRPRAVRQTAETELEAPLEARKEKASLGRLVAFALAVAAVCLAVSFAIAFDRGLLPVAVRPRRSRAPSSRSRPRPASPRAPSTPRPRRSIPRRRSILRRRRRRAWAVTGIDASFASSPPATPATGSGGSGWTATASGSRPAPRSSRARSRWPCG